VTETKTTSVSPEQRFNKAHPCPICGGYDGAGRGQAERCFGFLSRDKEYAHCTREEYAGDLDQHPKTEGFAHKLTGKCRCGEQHGPDDDNVVRLNKRSGKRSEEATYDYTDELGELLYQVVRYKPKDFRQRRPDDKGRWQWNLDGTRRVLYRLPEILAADLNATVYKCEGEKDVDRVRAEGLLATTNAQGAKKWREEFADALKDRRVVILPHNDESGREHAELVARSLSGKVRSVKILELPGLPEDGGDVYDYFEGGGTAEELEQLANEAPEWGEKAWEQCKALALQDDLTAAFAETLQLSGVAGESRQMRLLYLGLNSRQLDKPVSMAVKGTSSSGKSHLVEQVLKAFPKSAYYELTAMSEKALIYLDEDMRHRFLVVFEASGMAGDMQTYLMRTLLSEHRIRYQTAESTSQGVKPRLLELEGPTGLIVTTTQTRMHPENETRLFSLTVTDTREQTKAIFEALAEEDREPVDIETWRQLQVWLEGQAHTASVPYGKVLASMVPPVAVRLRRDFGAVLQLIRSHAILHQASREKDNKGRVIATLQDYAVVRQLVADLVAEGVDATVSKTMRQTVKAVTKLTSGDKEHIGIKPLAAELKLDKASTSRRVKAAREAGYLVNLEETKGKPAKIAAGEPLPADLVILPTPKTLATAWECCSVAVQTEGREGGTDSKHGSVANADCNGVQQCNTLKSENPIDKASNEGDETLITANTDEIPPFSASGGRGSFESATVQHPPGEGENTDVALQHATVAQHSGGQEDPAQHTLSVDEDGDWGEI
jgi:hypothetical protein